MASSEQSNIPCYLCGASTWSHGPNQQGKPRRKCKLCGATFIFCKLCLPKHRRPGRKDQPERIARFKQLLLDSGSIQFAYKQARIDARIAYPMVRQMGLLCGCGRVLTHRGNCIVRVRFSPRRRESLRRASYRASALQMGDRLRVIIERITPDIAERAEVMQEIAVALLSGEMHWREVEGRIREFIRRAYRHRSKRFNHVFIDHHPMAGASLVG